MTPVAFGKFSSQAFVYLHNLIVKLVRVGESIIYVIALCNVEVFRLWISQNLVRHCFSDFAFSAMKFGQSIYLTGYYED